MQCIPYLMHFFTQFLHEQWPHEVVQSYTRKEKENKGIHIRRREANDDTII